MCVYTLRKLTPQSLIGGPATFKLLTPFTPSSFDLSSAAHTHAHKSNQLIGASRVVVTLRVLELTIF